MFRHPRILRPPPPCIKHPRVIQNLKGDLNDILQQRILQVITEGGAQLKQVGPQLLKGAIEDAYQTPFRMLGKFGKSKLAEATQQLNRELDKIEKHVGILKRRFVSRLLYCL